MRKFTQETPRPRNRRVEPGASCGWMARLRARIRGLGFGEGQLARRLITRWFGAGVTWSMNQRTAGRAIATAIVVGWAMLTMIGLVRAWSLEGPYQDRAEELSGVQQQLHEARAHTVLLESQLKAIDKRAEVRMTVIRQELGMVRPNERIVRFRGTD